MLFKSSLIFLFYLASMIVLPLTAGGPLMELLPPTIDVELIKTFNQPFLGVIHWPSLIFICLSYVVLKRGETGLPKSESSNFFNDLQDAEVFFDKSYQNINNVENNDQQYRNFDNIRQSSDLKARLLQLIYHGGSDADVNRLLEIESSNYRESATAKIKNTTFAATLLPLLGMAGTITGLMFIFSGDLQAGASAEESFDQKFAGMGIALLTTLYATIITSLLAKPSQHSQQHQFNRALIAIERAENYVLMFKHKLNLSEWVMYSKNAATEQDIGSKNTSSEELRGAA